MSSPTPSGSSTEDVPVLIPGPPFDSTDADVILRSSDGADFHLHRAILSLVSPVLGAMFSLPQPDPAPKVPVIQVAEGAAMLNRALRFFYPGTQLIAETPTELRQIISVLVDKYDARCLVPAAKEHLRRFIVDQPLAAYIVAYTAYDSAWDDLEIAAAKQLLRRPLRVIDTAAPAELDVLPTAAYHNLLRYHYMCGQAALRTTKVLRWVPAANDYVWFSCTTCTRAPLAWYLSDGALHNVRNWFDAYLARVGDALEKTPGMEIGSHESVNETLKAAAECSICRPKVFGQFPQWVKTCLQPQITQAVEKVELHLSI